MINKPEIKPAPVYSRPVSSPDELLQWEGHVAKDMGAWA